MKVINLYELDSLTRRAFLGAAAALVTASFTYAQDDIPALKKNRLTFENAKKGSDYSKIKYLEQVLVEEYKLVQDPKKNPDGFVKTFFYWPHKEHQRKAFAALADRARALGEQTEPYLDYVRRALPQYCFWPIHVGALGVGKTSAAKSASLIMDAKLFELESEDEFLSKADLIYKFMFTHENNLSIKGAPLALKNRYLNTNSLDLAQLDSAAFQLERILSGARKNISAGFRNNAVKNYCTHYQECRNDLAFYVENRFVNTDQGRIESPSIAEAADTTGAFLADVDARFEKLGYAHLNENGTWILKKK